MCLASHVAQQGNTVNFTQKVKLGVKSTSCQHAPSLSACKFPFVDFTIPRIMLVFLRVSFGMVSLKNAIKLIETYITYSTSERTTQASGPPKVDAGIGVTCVVTPVAFTGARSECCIVRGRKVNRVSTRIVSIVQYGGLLSDFRSGGPTLTFKNQNSNI